MSFRAVRGFLDCLFKTGPGRIEKLLGAGGIALSKRNAPFEKTFRGRSRIGVGKFFKWRDFNRAPSRGEIALNHCHVPTTRRHNAIGINVRWTFREERLQQMGIALPPEIDVTALSFCNERRRRHRAHPLSTTRCLRPPPHCGVGENQIARDVRILGIELAYPLVTIERLLPFSLSPFDCRDQSARFAVVRG